MDSFKIPYEGFWINNWIARRAELTPNWIALIDDVEGDRRITFKEFNERVDKVAGYLKYNLGVKKGDVIAILSWPRIEMLDVLFACMKLGAVYLPINTRYTVREIKEVIIEAEPKVFFFEPEFKDKVDELAKEFKFKAIVIGDLEGYIKYKELLEHENKLEEPETVDLEHPVMLIQTGGTTGKPKLAIINHRHILWNIVNTVRDLIVPGDTTITALPFFHVGGFVYTLPLLFWGGTNIIMRRWNVDKFIDLVERERPTFLFLVPAQLNMLVKNKRFWESDFSSVRWITSGGAALTPSLIKQIFKKGVVQKQGYGLTEMGPGVFALDPWDAERKMGSIGKPNMLVEVKVVKKGKEVKKPGEEGLMLLRGPSLFGGYWKKEDKTREAFMNGWFNTGDIVRFDKEGYFWVVGREKNIIRSGAENVFPEELEKLLLDHPKIVDVVVIGVPDEKWGEVPKAIIVLKEGEKITKEEIIEWLKDKVAKYKIPKYIEVVDKIPRTETGKISRKMISKLFGEPKDKL